MDISYRDSWHQLRVLIFVMTLVFLSGIKAYGQTSITKSKLHGREAYTLENEKIRISMLTGGGYFGEIRLISSDPLKSVNPMRVPHYATIDPQDYEPNEHDLLYGDGGDCKVMAGYMGHFLCFPYVGGANSKLERNLGFATHGEAAVVKWNLENKQNTDKEARLRISADLPLSSYKVRRLITLVSGQTVIKVEEEVENLAGFDRPFQWVQHVTFGNPFISFGKTFVDAPVSRIAFSAQKDDPSNQNSVQWPLVKTAGGELLNAGVFNMQKGEGTYRDWLMDQERTHTWFTMYNKDYNVLIGYVFPKEQNPWIGDWQENGMKKHMPWNGEAVAWGLLVGTSPFTSGVRQSIERGPVFDTKTYGWIGAKEKLKQSYLIFMTEIENDFMGVDELRIEKGTIYLVEKETAKQIRVL